MTMISSGGELVAQGPSGAAIAFVAEGWDFFEEKANRFTELALQLIGDMVQLPQVVPTYFHVEFPTLEGLTAFDPPTRPSLPEIEFRNVPIPEAPNLGLPSAPAMVAPPTFDVAAPPLIALPAQPGAFDAADPGEAPEVTTLVLPEAPALALPELPELLTISLPELPTLALPAFATTDPGQAPVLPDLASAGFTEQAYSHKLVDDMLPVIRNGIASGQLLSPAIERALFQRGRDRTRRSHKAALQKVSEQFTGRGFKQPPGAWGAARREQVRTNLEETNALNRDLTVQLHQEAIKNVQFAIERGIGLEQLLIGQHNQVMDRALQSSRLLLDTHVALFNAQVSSYNAAIERMRADADVFRVKLEGEVAKLELYKAQVDGQRAIAEVNKAAVELYESRVRALGELVNQYKVQVDAVLGQAEIEKTRIEGYRARVQAFGERVNAYGERWNGFRAAVEAQQAGFRSYEIGVNAYGARVQAWAEGERAKSSRFETDIKASGLVLEGYRSRIQQAVAQLQVEQGRIGALGTKSEALSRIYQADGQIALAQNDANTRAFEAQVNYHDRRAQVQLREAEIKIQDSARILASGIEAVRGAAQALATLAASAMSAVNFSAGVNGSGSENTSWSYALSKSLGWSWAGETEDNNSPPVF